MISKWYRFRETKTEEESSQNEIHYRPNHIKITPTTISKEEMK